MVTAVVGVASMDSVLGRVMETLRDECPVCDAGGSHEQVLGADAFGRLACGHRFDATVLVADQCGSAGGSSR